MSPRDGTPGYLHLMILSAGIALAAIFVLLLGQRWYAEVDEQAEELREQARTIGANASAALLFNDPAAGREILSALRNSSEVKTAALYRVDGAQLAEFHRRDGEALPARWTKEDPSAGGSRLQNLYEMQVVMPIRVDDHDAGTIVLLASMHRVYGELGEFFWFFAIIVLASLGLAYFASHGMRRRIRESRTALEESQIMIRQLSVHREKVVEDEHKRIASEIHDDLGQILTTALLRLKHLDKSLEASDPAAASQVEEIEALVNDAFRSTKNIAMDLRPAALNFGFVPALQWLTERTLGHSGIKFQIDVPNPAPNLEEHASTTLFRIVQESLANTIRHAQAKNLWIALKMDEEHLMLTIEDDGVGFSTQPQPNRLPGFGLLGIRERAESLHGRAEISSTPGGGVSIVVMVPRTAIASPQ